MAGKRAARKKVSLGSCGFSSVSPAREKLSASTKTLNIHIPFEDALKLHLAIHEGVRKLNLYDRSTKAGKRASLNLVVHLSSRRIAVMEA